MSDKPNEVPAGVVCHWEYLGLQRLRDELWYLAETYVTDTDGRPVGRLPKTTWGRGVAGWRGWLTHDPEKVGGNRLPVKGRAATLWTWGGGVTLLGMNQPEFCDWLTPSFYQSLTSRPDWWALVQGGEKVYQRTIKEAVKVITEAK
jgi:hypothetical protein